MDYQRQSNGWMTFLEHHWFLVVVIPVLVASLLLSFFTKLTSSPWICCYGVALFAAGVGVALIFYCKLFLYRQRRFFTFGSAPLPESRRPFYCWGYRCVIFAVALLLCLLLASP